MTFSAAASLRPAVGWVFCAALAAVLFSLLAAPPPRDLPAFVFPASLPLGEGGGTLAGSLADIVAEGGFKMPDTYRYHYLPGGQEAANEDVEIVATYFVSPRLDARKFPEFYAARPWEPTPKTVDGWAASATQHSDGPERAWLRIDETQGIYLVSRVAPDGRCTSTEEQVRQLQLDHWHHHPWRPLSWPFSTRPELDQRAVWVRMTVSKRPDGSTCPPESIDKIWRDVLAAFSRQARLSMEAESF